MHSPFKSPLMLLPYDLASEELQSPQKEMFRREVDG